MLVHRLHESKDAFTYFCNHVGLLPIYYYLLQKSYTKYKYKKMT